MKHKILILLLIFFGITEYGYSHMGPIGPDFEPDNDSCILNPYTAGYSCIQMMFGTQWFTHDQSYANVRSITAKEQKIKVRGPVEYYINKTAVAGVFLADTTELKAGDSTYLFGGSPVYSRLTYTGATGYFKGPVWDYFRRNFMKFYKDGSILEGSIAEDREIAVPSGTIQVKKGSKISFYYTGKIEKIEMYDLPAELKLNNAIYNVREILIDKDGYVKAALLSTDAIFYIYGKQVLLPSHNPVWFHNNGLPKTVVLSGPHKQVIKGNSINLYYAIDIDESGKPLKPVKQKDYPNEYDDYKKMLDHICNYDNFILFQNNPK